jgi:hypothetical protein
VKKLGATVLYSVGGYGDKRLVGWRIEDRGWDGMVDGVDEGPDEIA